MVSREQLGSPVKWIRLDPEEIGSRSVSKDKEALKRALTSISSLPLKKHKRIEKAVNNMVLQYNALR